MLALAEVLPLWNALAGVAVAPGPIHRWAPTSAWDASAEEVHPVATAIVALGGVSRHAGPGQATCDLQPGECLLIAAGCAHRHLRLRADSAYLAIGSDVGVCDLELHRGPAVVELAVPEEPCAGLLAAAAADPRPERMGDLLRQILREPLGERPPPPACVRRMRDCIRTRALRGIDAEDVIRASGIGRSAAHQHFRAYYGATPHQVLEARRCRIARSLIAQGVPIAECVARVGYRQRQTFVRAYRRVFGEGP